MKRKIIKILIIIIILANTGCLVSKKKYVNCISEINNLRDKNDLAVIENEQLNKLTSFQQSVIEKQDKAIEERNSEFNEIKENLDNCIKKLERAELIPNRQCLKSLDDCEKQANDERKIFLGQLKQIKEECENHYDMQLKETVEYYKRQLVEAKEQYKMQLEEAITSFEQQVSSIRKNWEKDRQYAYSQGMLEVWNSLSFEMVSSKKSRFPFKDYFLTLIIKIGQEVVIKKEIETSIEYNNKREKFEEYVYKLKSAYPNCDW